MQIGNSFWRPAFFALLGFVLVAIPLIGLEFHQATRSHSGLVERWVELADRCRAAIENRTLPNTADLTPIEPTDRKNHTESWLDESQLLVIDFTVPPENSEPRRCSVERWRKRPVADSTIAALLLAFMQMRTAAIASQDYIDDNPATELGVLVLTGYMKRERNSAGCLVTNMLVADSNNHEAKWWLAERPSQKGPGCR